MQKIIIIALAVISVGASAAAVYLYISSPASSVIWDSTKQDKIARQEEADEIIKKVGELIELPNNEVPTVATVSNPDALRNQPFFAKAKTGDKVLIFPKARKAILYDPLVHKILEVGPISLEPSDI